MTYWHVLGVCFCHAAPEGYSSACTGIRFALSRTHCEASIQSTVSFNTIFKNYYSFDTK
jgi:hypothetical protein